MSGETAAGKRRVELFHGEQSTTGCLEGRIFLRDKVDKNVGPRRCGLARFPAEDLPSPRVRESRSGRFEGLSRRSREKLEKTRAGRNGVPCVLDIICSHGIFSGTKRGSAKWICKLPSAQTAERNRSVYRELCAKILLAGIPAELYGRRHNHECKYGCVEI